MWIYVRIYILAQSYLVPRSVLSGTSLIVWSRSMLWRNWGIRGLNIDIYVCVASSLSEFSEQRFSFLQLHLLSPSKVFGHCSYSTNIMEKTTSIHVQNCESVADSDPQTSQARKHEGVALGLVRSHAEMTQTPKDEF